MNRWLRHRAALATILALWITWLAVQFITGIGEARTDATNHGEPFSWTEYIIVWGNRVAENNASEMFQVAVAAIVFKHLLYVGSPESKTPRELGEHT